MGATGRLAGLVVAGLILAGCSETGFQDWFGAGKYIPDESLVQQGQTLSAPPDLGLRPPGDTTQPVQQAYQPPPQPDQSQQPIYQPQQTYQAPQPQQQVYQPPQQTYQVPQPQQQVYQQPPSPQPQVATDIYAKWGVSRYRPDGTEKSQPELNEELVQKKIAMERAKNPNYGTIFNMGSIWSDG